MTNIAELLKDAPKSMKLYSPLFGEVKLDKAGGMVYVTTKYGSSKCFTETGCYYVDNESFSTECLLFPSKDCRTWEGWKLPVEPKFKVGDWIVTDYGKVSQVVSVDNAGDGYTLDDGVYFSVSWCDMYHLWSIADTKYGDVLANTAGCILIAKDNKSCLCYIDKNGEFHADNNKWFFANFSDNALMPATKEQRKLLFHKMKESGYELNEKKKELCKIQHYDISNFHAGMPVLVRDYDNSRWSYVQFSHYVGECRMKFNACGIPYIQCIPFNEETKHLLGTTDMCPEEYINW